MDVVRSEMDPLDSWVEESILLVLFLISAAANSLPLVVFCRKPGLRTISNKFVMNLLSANVLTTCVLTPALVCERQACGAAWRHAVDAASAACSLAALLAVLLIAIDQHHAITDPLRCHARLLQRRPALLITAVWTVALVAGVLRAGLSAWADRQQTRLLANLETAYAGAYFTVGIAVPTLTVFVLYARIYGEARSSGLRARAHGASAMQLHEPPAPLPDLVEEGDGLTLKIDVPRPQSAVESERGKYGPYLLPPKRCPSVASLRTNTPRLHRSSEELRRLPAVSSAPTLANMPLLCARPAQSTSRITSLRCRISNASLFRYREESRAARVGFLTGSLVLLHAPHAGISLARAAGLCEVAEARFAALVLLVLAAAASPFLFALRSRRVQREARRIFLPEKCSWERAQSAATEGGQARAALDLLRTLSPGSGAGSCAAATCGRSSFSSGASTQLSSASDE